MVVGRLGGGRYRAPSSGGFGREGGFGLGPEGECVCPNCGYTVSHGLNDPCYLKKCPRCGATMTRKI